MKNIKLNLTKRIWKEHIKAYKSYFAKALICMAISAAATMAFPYFLKPAFDFIFQTQDKSDLIFFCICIFLSFAVKGASSYGETFIMTYIGQKIIFDIQERLFKHLVKSDLKFFNNHHSGDLLSRFSNDVTLMRNAVSTTLSCVGKDFLTFVFLVGLMTYRDPILSIFAFVIFPSAVIPIILLGRKMKKITHEMQNNLGSFSGNLSQIFQGIRIVKAYLSEDKEISRIKSKIDKLIKLIISSTKIKAALHPISECIAGLAIISVLAYGGMQIIEQQKTVGDLISFLSALLLAYEPIRRLTQLSANMQEGLAAAKRVFDILDTDFEIKDPNNPKLISNNIELIEFKNVSFYYNKSNIVLNDISFEVNKGKTIAFVGNSGAGKSTIINLIPRFYDIISGEIKINNTNIKDLSLSNLREKIAIVTQENILFDASFFENIAYGKENATLQEVKEAAKLALAHDFISASPNGYDTIVGENGIKISGGQRQRISIARAMLKNSPILLLDEATSALDTNSEKAVQKALETLMKNRTTLIVAHRLSSIVNSDTIYVLDSGSIKESGTHKELLEKRKLYYSLWMAQINEKKHTNK